MWFKEALGRYPHHDQGDSDILKDVLENWGRLEPKLRQERTLRQADLPVKIAVEGMRIGSTNWDAAHELSPQDLPPLNDAQREAARKMRMSEEDYARGFLAGEWSRSALLAKTERLARLLADFLKQLASGSALHRVVLSTTDRRFDVEIIHNGHSIPVKIREDVVDDLFEGGSSEAEKKILKILETAIKYQGRATQ